MMMGESTHENSDWAETGEKRPCSGRVWLLDAGRAVLDALANVGDQNDSRAGAAARNRAFRALIARRPADRLWRHLAAAPARSRCRLQARRATHVASISVGGR